MIAISSSYGIHLLHRYYEDIPNHTSQEGTREALKNISPALLITGITSALGTLTLLVFKVGMIRDFGILATIGMLVVVLLSLTYLPSMLVILKRQEHSFIDTQKTKTNWLAIIAKFASQQRYGIVISALLLLIVTIW